MSFAGWKDSVVASGELAAGAAAVKFLKDKGFASIEPLATLGQLRFSKGQTLGQIDAGAVAPGIALLVSKKTRGLMKDVDALWSTIQLITKHRNKYLTLKEFRDRTLYGERGGLLQKNDDDVTVLYLTRRSGMLSPGCIFTCLAQQRFF